MVKRKKARSKKNNNLGKSEEQTDLVQAPHSFVIRRGLPCPNIQDLVLDFRKIMEPFTAFNLKERKSNKIKDFISLSGIFHVSHLCIFNKATTQLSFKILRLPRGPTLTFKIHQFTLARDVISSSRKQFIDDESFRHAPLVVMNNFTGEGKHLKLMTATFQNMFPAINLATVDLSKIRRCLLFSYDPITKLIEIRHYTISVIPVGLSKGIKKVVLGKVPNLERYNDIEDFITQGNASESEFEDEEENEIILAQNLKRKGNLKDRRSSVRLHEIGPKITIELIKIEDGNLTGEVLFHNTIKKTKEEIEEIRRENEKKKKLKEKRKQNQMQNKLKKEHNKTKTNRDKRTDNKDNIFENDTTAPDDDAQYYREEVGEEPDEELFKAPRENSRPRVTIPKHLLKQNAKKRKHDDENNSKSSKEYKSKKLILQGGRKNARKEKSFKEKSGHLRKKRNLKT